MNGTNHNRTAVTAAETYPIHVEGADSELAVLFHDEWDAPRVLVLRPDRNTNQVHNGAQWFDLADVTVNAHAYLDEDGIEGVGPVEIEDCGEIDNINIRGVVRSMVAVDYADYASDTPRLLIFTEHTNDDDTPHAVPL